MGVPMRSLFAFIFAGFAFATVAGQAYEVGKDYSRRKVHTASVATANRVPVTVSNVAAKGDKLTIRTRVKGYTCPDTGMWWLKCVRAA